MKTVQGERDYAYGAAMLTLRTKISLTQTKLADRLGIARLAVCRWEAGSAYPKPEHLKALIALAVQHQAFPTGSEAGEIRQLWKIAHQKVLLDEHWLGALLASRNSSQGEVGESIQVRDIRQQTEVSPVSPNSANSELGANPVPCSNLLPPLPSVPPMEETMSSDVPTVSQRLEAETSGTLSPTVEMGSTQASGSVQDTISPIGARSNPRSDKTRGRNIRILALVLTLAIIVIAGAGGMLLLQARNHRDEQAQSTHSYPAYLPGNGTLAFFDPLNQERGSQWASYGPDSSDQSCQFTKGADHVSEPRSHYFLWCPAQGTFSNFAFEVQLTIMHGDCGGMIFRSDGNGHFYYFQICEDGTYWVTTFVDNIPSHAKDQHNGSTSALHTGLSHQNKIAVVASDSTLTFYANEQQIVQVQDSSYTSGTIALIANSGQGNATDVAYSNATLWTL